MSGGVHRQHPMMVTIRRPGEGQHVIRNPVRSVQKQLEARAVKELGRPLTKAQKKLAKKAAAQLVAEHTRSKVDGAVKAADLPPPEAIEFSPPTESPAA